MSLLLVVFGAYLILDGVYSITVFQKQAWWYQVPRVLRAAIGAILVLAV